jgi:hypothetical protein
VTAAFAAVPVPNSGRPKGIPNRWPAALAKEIARLSDAVESCGCSAAFEGTRILARLVAIECQLGLVEKPAATKYSSQRPVG